MTRVPTPTWARLLLGGALVFHLAPLTAAGSGAVQTQPQATQSKPAAASRVFQITVDRASFEDAPTGIKAGDTIEWVNKDVFDHTSTSRTGLWDVTIPAGKKARVVMKKAGTLEYYCKLHPNMTGTLVVR
jgi:plastocyanin